MFVKYVFFYVLSHLWLISGYELVGTVIVFRHGARTPRLFHLNDPYQNSSFWPAPNGELTEEGKRQAYELGTWTRQRYHDFLPQKYSSKDFFIYSSGIDRTLMSASLFAAGLYPTTTGSNLPFQPIPIHSKPPHIDNTILTDIPCPTRNFLYKKIMESDYFQNIAKENEQVYNYLSENMGMAIRSFKGLSSYYDTFFIEQWNNLTLPDWTKKVYPEKLRELALLNLITRTYTLESTRFGVGALLSEVLSYFTSFSNGTKEFESDFEMEDRGRKIMAISGHDINISDLLSVLKYPIDSWPSYTSSVILELRRKDDLYVKAFFKNTTGIYDVKINKCGTDCKLSEFVDHVRPVVMNPKDWRRQCQLKKLSDHDDVELGIKEKLFL